MRQSGISFQKRFQKKAAALLTASTVLFSSLTLMGFSSISSDTTVDQAPPYSGNLLIIANTAVSGGEESPGPLPVLANTALLETTEEEDLTPPAEGYAYQERANNGDNLLQIEPSFKFEGLENYLHEEIPEMFSVNQYQVGSNKTILSSMSIGGATQVNMTALYIGQYCTVWGDAENPSFTARQAEQLGVQFDHYMYPLMTSDFGNWLDRDNDGKLALMCYDIDRGISMGGGYVGGYFWASDFYNQNAMDMIHIDSNEGMRSGVTQCYGTIVHEFQHMINYSTSYNLGKGIMPTWLNEAFSEAASHLYEGVQSDRIRYYNNSSAIANGYSLTNWQGTLHNYSLSYLFGQYLRAQSNSSIYKKVLESSDDPLTAIVNNLDDIDSIDELFLGFRTALVAKESSGPFGFNGEPAFNNLAIPINRQSGSVNIPAGGGIVRTMTSDFTPDPVGVGSNIRFAGVNTDGSTPTPPASQLTTITISNIPKVSVPTSGAPRQVQYSARGQDQFFQEKALTNVIWSVTKSDGDAIDDGSVTINQTGLLTVTASAAAPSTILISAECEGIKGKITVALNQSDIIGITPDNLTGNVHSFENPETFLLETGSGSLTGLKWNETNLIVNTDYTLSGSDLTLTKEFLNKLPMIAQPACTHNVAIYIDGAPELKLSITLENGSLAPVIITQPVSKAITENGGSATFTIEAKSPDNGVLSYQWQASTDNGATWTDIDGETGDSYSTNDNSGRYLRCIVSNSFNGNLPESIASNQVYCGIAQKREPVLQDLMGTDNLYTNGWDVVIDKRDDGIAGAKVTWKTANNIEKSVSLSDISEVLMASPDDVPIPAGSILMHGGTLGNVSIQGTIIGNPSIIIKKWNPTFYNVIMLQADVSVYGDVYLDIQNLSEVSLHQFFIMSNRVNIYGDLNFYGSNLKIQTDFLGSYGAGTYSTVHENYTVTLENSNIGGPIYIGNPSVYGNVTANIRNNTAAALVVGDEEPGQIYHGDVFVTVENCTFPRSYPIGPSDDRHGISFGGQDAVKGNVTAHLTDVTCNSDLFIAHGSIDGSLDILVDGNSQFQNITQHRNKQGTIKGDVTVTLAGNTQITGGTGIAFNKPSSYAIGGKGAVILTENAAVTGEIAAKDILRFTDYGSADTDDFRSVQLKSGGNQSIVLDQNSAVQLPANMSDLTSFSMDAQSALKIDDDTSIGGNFTGNGSLYIAAGKRLDISKGVSSGLSKVYIAPEETVIPNQIYCITEQTPSAAQFMLMKPITHSLIKEAGAAPNVYNWKIDDGSFHTVTFDANGGKFSNGDPTREVKISSRANTLPQENFPSNPTMINDEGEETKSFLGWYTQPEDGEPFNSMSFIDDDRTVYARWGDLLQPPLINATANTTTVDKSIDVTISAGNQNYIAIYYTLDSSSPDDPDNSSARLYDGTFPLKTDNPKGETILVRAVTYRSNQYSAVAERSFTFTEETAPPPPPPEPEAIEPPVISTDREGPYAYNQTVMVTLSHSLGNDVSLYYTTNGSAPVLPTRGPRTVQATRLYTGPFAVSLNNHNGGTITIRAIAVKNNVASAVAAKDLRFSPDSFIIPPWLSPPEILSTNLSPYEIAPNDMTVDVILTHPQEAEIFYTTDGSHPETSSTRRSGTSFTLTAGRSEGETIMVKAVAYNGSIYSEAAQREFVFAPVKNTVPDNSAPSGGSAIGAGAGTSGGLNMTLPSPAHAARQMIAIGLTGLFLCAAGWIFFLKSRLSACQKSRV